MAQFSTSIAAELAPTTTGAGQTARRRTRRRRSALSRVSGRVLGALGSIGLGALVVAMATLAEAQGLSNRPITIVVPYTPGTGIDIVARIVGDELRARWNQPVVVDNRPGASGNIGTQFAARARPDGHTLMTTANTFVTNVPLAKNAPYDPVRSFVPIVEAATGAIVLAVHPSVPVDSARAFVEEAKRRPGDVTYASPGIGTPQHLAMELFKLSTGTDVRHIPYKGSAGAVADLTGGHVNAMFLPLHTALPFVEKGRIKLLAVGSAERSPLAPDVPTLAEQGVQGFDVAFWYGLLAPAGTPRDVIDRLNAAVNEILQAPHIREALGKQGLVAVGGTSERFAELIAKDLERWTQVVTQAGITAEE